MHITTDNYSPTYRAKFFHTEDLKRVVEFAVETNRFDKLNKARKCIDSSFLTRRLKFELGVHPEGYPIVTITRYTPRKGIIPRYMTDYTESEPFHIISYKKINPLKFGLDTIVKLGNSAPHNNLFKKIVSGITTTK